MTERRVAQVVRQTGGSDDILDVGLMLFQLRVFLGKFFHRAASDGASHAGHFEAVRQAVVHHLCARKRKHLCLVLQPAKGAAEEDAVVVALKAAADVGAFLRLRIAFVGEEVGPVHGVVSLLPQN